MPTPRFVSRIRHIVGAVVTAMLLSGCVQSMIDPMADGRSSGTAMATGITPEMTAMAGPHGPAIARDEAAPGLPAADTPPEALAPANADADVNRSNEVNRRNDAGGDADTRVVSMHLQRAPVRHVLQGFATFAGKDIVISDSVQGEVSMNLVDLPWQHAFAVLLRSRGLTQQQEHGVIWVAPAAEIDKRRQESGAADAKRADEAPLRSQLFVLHYQRADAMRELIAAGTGAQTMLSKRGALSADTRTNRLFVTDTPARLAHIRQLVAAFDQPTRQVLIEARIVEADAGFSQHLGARLMMSGESGESGGQRTPSAISAPGNAFYQLAAASLLGAPAAQAAFTLFKAGADRVISLELGALEAQGRGRVLSSPRVVTTDRYKATIEQGTEVPYQSNTRRGGGGRGAGSTQFRRASLKLEVTPHIRPDRQVLLDVVLAKDSLGVATDAGYAIDTKQVQTQVEVENGGTVAIGGIFSRATRRDVLGVPWLQRIPFLGALFRRTSRSERKVELLILLTPTVLDAVTTIRPADTLTERG